MWKLIAKLIAWPIIANWLIKRSQLTPYKHIKSHDKKDVYMWRWWLFNPYSRTTNKPKFWWCPWSIRIHHIMRPDSDRDLHDHPWNARTIILRGWYVEERLLGTTSEELDVKHMFARHAGDTAKLGFGEYHRIDRISPGGVFTLFISGPWQGVWGFKVNGVKVPWKTYLNVPEGGDTP